MNYNLYRLKDNVEGKLDAGISASATVILLQTGQGALFPSTYSGTATSGGTATTLNSTGIGASGVAVGDFIRNTTDGSHGYVLTVLTNSITTTSLLGGTDNTWQNSDGYASGPFVITINTRDGNDNITAQEKVLIDSRSGDQLNVAASGRGFDGTVAQIWAADDFVNLFVESKFMRESIKAFAETFEQLDLKASVNYVNGLLAQQNWKTAVRVATTAAGTLASSFENGDTIDGVVLATGDRILIKNQAAGAENGIYTVNASGAPTRATDFDIGSEAVSAIIPVTAGSVNADSIWFCTNDTVTIGVTALIFTQLNQAFVKATQPEADAGTDDTKFMTPLKTSVARATKNRIIYGTLGETISASDLTNDANLVYQNPTDMKWYKVTSTASTWYNRLGIALESGALNDVKLIMLEGVYNGLTFSNINPTFSSNLTGTDNLVGDSVVNVLRAFLIADNTTGAEAIVTDLTASVKKVGTPPSSLFAQLILEQQEQPNTPAAYWSSLNAGNGAQIALATFTEASVGVGYADLTRTLGGNIRIPAGAKVYAVFGTDAAPDAANYYVVQSNAQTLAYSSLSNAWSGTVNGGKTSLTVVSTSPIGYGIKAYSGTNGTYGLLPTNNWARVIGHVTSTSEFYFDPDFKRNNLVWRGSQHVNNNNAAASGFINVNVGFCPSNIRLTLKFWMDATTDRAGHKKGWIRGDCTNSSLFQVESFNDGSSTQGSTHWDGATDLAYTGGTNGAAGQLTSSQEDQNKLYAIRTEVGAYIYSGYPSGAGYISENAAGFVQRKLDFEVFSEY